MRQLCYYGNPILRTKSAEIQEISEEVKLLVADMIRIMKKYNGIGIAANQVGVALRVFISRLEKEDESGKLIYYKKPRVFINPVLTNPSEKKVSGLEGCLSLPDIRAKVVRPFSINVTAKDLEGNVFSQVCSGFVARVVMHENDHLNGVLYVDRLSKKDKNKIEPLLEDIKRRFSFEKLVI